MVSWAKTLVPLSHRSLGHNIHPNKMAGKKGIGDLSDCELMSELKSLGLNVGPISPTTRRIYEKRLSKARGCDVVDSTNENQDARANVSESVSTNLNNSISDSTNRTSSEALESPAIFYGVCFDVVRSSNSESGLPSVPAVFTSKDEALKTAKKFKGARFKGFKNRDEAESFSRSRSKEQENSPAVTSSLSSPADPVSNFKGPTPQELVKFRKIIENGSRDEVYEMALKNPRYLIGPGDTPVILQEGFRYNALHVAVKNNRKEMCQLIIDTLESEHFWNILLNQETQSVMNSQRKQFLVDMYLNTPDKGNWETPLHFACKFGHADVVECLVSHPLTDSQRANKYGETPAQVICSRCTAPSSELKNQIRSFLEDSCFVPLMGSVDNATPPWIRGPWSPEVTDKKKTREPGSPGSQGSALSNSLKQKNSPGEMPITVRAYAGPMSPSKAEEFYLSWKTPPKPEQRNSYIQIKRKDDSRGVERIGRELAHNGKIPWMEYWNFLGCYADLSSPQGLEKLEDYLGKKKDRILSSRLSVTPQRVRNVKSTGSAVLKTPESRQSSVILSDDGLPKQTGNNGGNNHGDESVAMEFRKDHRSTSRKIWFLDSEMETDSADVEGKKDAPCVSKQQNFMENISNCSSPLNQTSDVKLNEPVVMALAESLDVLSLHKDKAVTEIIHDTLLPEDPGKEDELKESSCSVERSNVKDDVDNAGVLPCKKKLSYHSPENKSELLDIKDENLATDREIKVQLVENKNNVENCKRSAILENVRNENLLSSSSLLSSPSPKKNPSSDLRENSYDDEVFASNSGNDVVGSAGEGCTSFGHVGHHNFKEPENRNVRHVKCAASGSHVPVSGNAISIFIQGMQPSKLDLDVLIAIGQVNIDSGKYPSVTQWKKLVTSYSEEKQQSWPSPGSPRFHTRHKSLMWSC